MSEPKQLNVDYVAAPGFSNGFTWRELRDLIDQLPEGVKDRQALVCSEPPKGENPYGIYGLMVNHENCGPMMIQEY